MMTGVEGITFVLAAALAVGTIAFRAGRGGARDRCPGSVTRPSWLESPAALEI
jgi:hypothetical protein